uniref:Uncharacterized protein n=1 Tax=Magallana gigas TaxID=29159 RepID=K1RQN8_MAGGI
MDIKRWTTKFDCNCKINYDKEALNGQPSKGLPKPSTSECNAPKDFCPRSGFCKKNQKGVCRWGIGILELFRQEFRENPV